MNLFKRSIAKLAAIGLLAIAPMGDLAIAAEIEWKMHVVWVSAREEAKMAQTFAERINARTGDSFKLTVYPGGSLGVRDADMLRILPSGNVIQATLLSTTYVARDAPDLAYSMPEGVLSSAEDILKIAPALDDIYRTSFDKWGIKYLGSLLAPEREFSIFCKSPVNTLEELRKKKLRVWSKTLADSFDKIGVSPTIIPQSELYVALQTGVVDCATYYPGPAATFSIQEVAPHWAPFANVAIPGALIVSQSAWDKLPDGVQAIIAEEANAFSAELTKAFVAGTYEKAQSEHFNGLGGKALGSFPGDERQLYRAAARDVWKKVSEDLGGSAMENQERLLAILESN